MAGFTSSPIPLPFAASFARLLRFAAAACAALIAACSGGGSGPPPAPPSPASFLLGFVGAVPDAGNIDGPAGIARFELPSAIAVDARTGTIYIADNGNRTIRKLTADGVVSTLAGAPGQFGYVDGIGSAARFGTVTGLAIDANGVLYAADSESFTIRRIEPDGRVSTLAGTGQRGSADGMGTGASFYNPTALAIDPFANLYVGDEYVIRKITPAGAVTTVAGKFGELGTADGIGSGARLGSQVFGLAADRMGNVFILEGARLRKLSLDGMVATVVGGEPRIILNPSGIAIDENDNLYIADSITHVIVKVSPQGQVFSPPVAGTGVGGVENGPRASATLRGPALAFSPGRLIMAERLDNVIRQVSLETGAMSLLAGQALSLVFDSMVDGIGQAARFVFITDLVTDGSANLYVNDNARIRRITTAARVSTISDAFVGSVNALSADAAGTLYVAQGLLCGDPPSRSSFPCGMKLSALAPNGSITLLREFTDRLIPSAMARDSGGNLYIAVHDYTASSDYVLKVDAARAVSVFWRGIASDLAIGNDGNVYASDATSHVIRRISAAGDVLVIAGKVGEAGDSDGPGAAARFTQPRGLAVDGAGNLYVADHANNLVRKMTPQAIVSTVAGTRGSRGFAPGAAPGLLKSPAAVAIIGGDLYIAMPNAVALLRPRP